MVELPLVTERAEVSTAELGTVVSHQNVGNAVSSKDRLEVTNRAGATQVLQMGDLRILGEIVYDKEVCALLKHEEVCADTFPGT